MESLPFVRGGTFYGQTPIDTTQGNHLLGQEFTMPDDTYGTGRQITLRCVRNLVGSGINVYGKTLAVLDKTGTTIIGVTNTDAYGSPASAGGAGPIAFLDEKLPSAGVAYQDICYVVVEGLALALNQMATIATNVINVGDFLNAVTLNVATTAAATGGRVKTRVVSSSVTAAQIESEGVIARALSAVATSGQSNVAILVDVIRRL